jgi:hypothetical protein
MQNRGRTVYAEPCVQNRVCRTVEERPFKGREKAQKIRTGFSPVVRVTNQTVRPSRVPHFSRGLCSRNGILCRASRDILRSLLLPTDGRFLQQLPSFHEPFVLMLRFMRRQPYISFQPRRHLRRNDVPNIHRNHVRRQEINLLDGIRTPIIIRMHRTVEDAGGSKSRGRKTKAGATATLNHLLPRQRRRSKEMTAGTAGHITKSPDVFARFSRGTVARSLSYSYRSATIGSTRVARRAGM